MLRLRLIATFVLVAVCTGWAASCVLGGFDRVDDPPGSSTGPDANGGGGSGGGGGGGGTGNEPCPSAGWPPPPGVADAGGNESFTVAVRRIRVSPEVDGGAVGIDLDKECTCCQCEGARASCRATPGALLDAGCDDPEGRDNVFGALFAMLGRFLGVEDLNEYYSAGAEAGEWSILLRVEDYNGQSDDDQVTLIWYTTPGLPLLERPPAWDGGDDWPVSATSCGTGSDGGPDLGSPIYVDERAYVVADYLVASLPKTEMIVGAGLSYFAIKLTAGGLMARIEQVDEGTALLNGTIAGRVAERDLFDALSSYRDEVGSPFCTDDGLYSLAKLPLCMSRDILEGVGSPTESCTALSWGIEFDAYPAHLGPTSPPLLPTDGCVPEADPANDLCIP